MIRSLQENTLPEKPRTEPGSFETRNLNKRFLLIFSGLIGLHLGLTFWTQFFPYVDLPFHLAAATIYRYYGLANNQFADYYAVEAFLRPNIFHLLFTGSLTFMSVETANKVYQAIYIILFPVSVLCIIRQIRGNIWLALLSFLLIYNFNVSFGFVGYYFSIPLSLFILYLTLLSLENNALWIKFLTSALFVLVYFTHAQTSIFCLLFYGLIYGFYNRSNWKNLLLAFVTVLPVLLIVLYWWFNTQGESNTLGYLKYFYRSEYLSTLAQRVSLFYRDNYFLFKGNRGILVACIFSLVLFAPATLGVFFNHKAIFAILQHKKQVSFMLFMLLILGCYFVLPVGIPGHAYIYQRFSVYLLLSVIIFGSLVFPEQFLKQFIAIFILAVLVHFGAYAQKHWAFQQAMKGYDPEFFPKDSGNKILAGVMLERDFRGYDEFLHVPNYYIVWNKGVAVTSVIDYRFGAIRRKASFETLPYYDESFVFGPDQEFPYRNQDYILVKSILPKTVKTALKDFKLIKSNNNWHLFQRIEE